METTKEITLSDATLRVKLHHAAAAIRRAFARLAKARLDRRIRAELKADGYTIEDLGGGDWRVDVRRMKAPAQMRMSAAAVRRLCAEIEADTTGDEVAA